MKKNGWKEEGAELGVLRDRLVAGFEVNYIYQ